RCKPIKRKSAGDGAFPYDHAIALTWRLPITNHEFTNHNTYTNRNRPSQTTSTKCQYQATASNAKWFSLVKWPLAQRNHMISSISVPRVTCAPWKPVSMKNVEP